MAGWGALMGLGEGLQQAGKAWQDRDKQKLADQLEREREERAEQRAIAKEERTAQRLATTVAEQRPQQDSNGVWYMQGYNAAGTPIGEPRIATEGEIQSARMARDKDRVSLDKLTADAELAKFKADRAPLESEQEDRLFEQKLRAGEADIGATDAQAAYYRSGGSRGRGGLEAEDTGPIPTVDVAKSLVEEYEDLNKEFGLTPSEAMELATRVIRTAREQGKDPADTYRRAVPEFRARKPLGKTQKKSLDL